MIVKKILGTRITKVTIVAALLMTLPICGFASTGLIRSVKNVIDESSAVYKIQISSGMSRECQVAGGVGNALILYKGVVKKSYKGKNNDSKLMEFCGTAGLIINKTYVVALDKNSDERRLRFQADAVFMERGISSYYRLMSYESDTVEIDGKNSIVYAVESAELESYIKTITP